MEFVATERGVGGAIMVVVFDVVMDWLILCGFGRKGMGGWYLGCEVRRVSVY